MRKVLFVLCLLTCMASAYCAPLIAEANSESVYRRIAELQAEARQVAVACGGDEAVAAIFRQIEELTAGLPRNPRGSLDQGGEDCATATVVTGLPYCDAGTTVGANNDYNPLCETSSNAPDVVYVITPATTVTVSISLCGSSFNTVLHVYRPPCPLITGGPVCCNDDFCGQQSCCPAVTLLGGVTHYIVVDGAGSAAGDYVLNIGPQGACGNVECACIVTCPAASTPEGEGCPPGFPDNYNAGCFGFPFAATPLDCGQTICGSGYWDTTYLDHDAYIVTIHQRDSLRWCMSAEFDFQMDVHQFFSAG